MKNLKYTWILCLVILSAGFISCNDDDEYFDDKYQDKTIVIDQIYLEDYESSVPDRPVEFARLGQLIRVEGSGLYGMKKVYINGYETYFNRVYVTDKSMLIQINSNTPIVDADPEERDYIRFIKDKKKTSFNFTIRAASPTITGISNTLPKANERVVVYGTGLDETEKITLPGGVVVVNDINNSEDGEWYSFVMPDNITEGGYILSEGAHGQAQTPSYFNNSSCIILDFDGNGAQGFWSWSETGSMINDEDLADDPANSGRGKCVPIVPDRLLENGISSGKPRVTECWTAGNGSDPDDWTRMTEFIPATTPLTEVALQFDVYVANPWSGTGHIQICLINNFNFAGIGSDDDGANNVVAFYVPWITDEGVVPFHTDGWQTATIPFSEFNKYATLVADKEATQPTFQTVIDDRNAATYRNFGMGFINTDFSYLDTSVTSTLFTEPSIYIDNWRVVPCKSVIISDYPEDDEITE